MAKARWLHAIIARRNMKTIRVSTCIRGREARVDIPGDPSGPDYLDRLLGTSITRAKERKACSRSWNLPCKNERDFVGVVTCVMEKEEEKKRVLIARAYISIMRDNLNYRYQNFLLTYLWKQYTWSNRTFIAFLNPTCGEIESTF